jgi:hypothetical protein
MGVMHTNFRVLDLNLRALQGKQERANEWEHYSNARRYTQSMSGFFLSAGLHPPLSWTVLETANLLEIVARLFCKSTVPLHFHWSHKPQQDFHWQFFLRKFILAIYRW